MPFISFNPTSILEGRYHYVHCSDDEMEAQKLRSPPPTVIKAETEQVLLLEVPK